MFTTSPNGRIGLDLLARADKNGWHFDWLTFDEGYGGKPGFLQVLDLAGATYAGEVPKSFSCRPGRRRTALTAAAVFAQPGVRQRAAKAFRFAQQTGPAAVWQVKVVDVALGTDRRPRHRLILARNRETGEKKYFLTNAPRRLGVRRVLAAALVRWQIEKAQADYPSRRRWVTTHRIGYHRRNGVARAGRVVPATPRCSHRRSRMSDTTRRRPVPPRA